MHTLHAPVTEDGALVEVLVGLAAPDLLALRHAGRPVPNAVSVRAVLDTAAEVSCVDPQVLTPLAAVGATLLRFVLANVPALGGLGAAGVYNVGLTIVHPSGDPSANLVLRNQPVMEQSLNQLGYQTLIGRDILDRCLLVYDGPGQTFTLGYWQHSGERSSQPHSSSGVPYSCSPVLRDSRRP